MLIYNQHDPRYRSLTYGRAKVGDCGCEAVAAYNALEMLGKPMPFGEVIRVFEHRFSHGGGFGGKGKLGASPRDLTLFFRSLGYTPQGGSLKKMQGISEPGVFILTYWNKPFTHGLHTVAIRFDGHRYTAVNYIVKLCTKEDISDFLPDKMHYFYCFHLPFSK